MDDKVYEENDPYKEKERTDNEIDEHLFLNKLKGIESRAEQAQNEAFRIHEDACRKKCLKEKQEYDRRYVVFKKAQDKRIEYSLRQSTWYFVKRFKYGI